MNLGDNGKLKYVKRETSQSITQKLLKQKLVEYLKDEDKGIEALQHILDGREKKENIALHFDMHHGYGNLDLAIEEVQEQDRSEFKKFVYSQNSFNPHIMFIAKRKITNDWFNTLFPWLERCEKKFGFNKLSGYDTTRLYAYLAERYLSFWFKKYTKYLENSWIFFDNS